jgi:CubicO group peptidase (beta-lactamase class C family)
MTKWVIPVFVVLASLTAAGQQVRSPKKAILPLAIRRLDGSTITTAEIDATVTRLMHAAKVTGISIGILNENKIAYLKAFGFRDKEKNLPLTSDSVMTTASLSKSAFACLVMQLVEQKVIDLEKPVYQYLPKPLPEYDNYKDLAGDPRYKKITARMLLSHTSGFPNWRRFTDDGKLSIHFKPGTRYAYSGEGIVLLQMVVESITKRSLTELMREQIFQPFGMSRTSMIWEPRFESDFANAYDEQEHSLGPQRRKHPDAAGGMQTSVGDFARLLEGVMQSKSMSRETRELMLSPKSRFFPSTNSRPFSTETAHQNKAIRLSYGLGWGLYWTPYGRAFFKEGHDDGLRHYAVCFDERSLGIVIMSNSSGTEGIYKELLETLVRNTFTPLEWEEFTPYHVPK